MVKNQRVAANIQAAVARHWAPSSGVAVPSQTPIQNLAKVRSIVDKRIQGERNWKVEEIAEHENLGYMTVYRALKGKPGWLAYGRTIRVTESLYRAWLTAVALGMSLEEYLSLPKAF